MAGRAIHDKLVTVRPGPGDAALGASAMNVLIHGIGGPASRNTPAFGALVALALIAHEAKPMVRATVHGVTVSSRDVNVVFDHRYGHHLIRPIHRHATRLRRSSRGVLAS